MEDLYAQQLEMQLRFAEEEAQEREMFAYEQGRADALNELVSHVSTTWIFIGDSGKPYRDEVKYIAERLKEQKNE